MILIYVPYHERKYYNLVRLHDWLVKQPHEVYMRLDTKQFGRRGAVKEQRLHGANLAKQLGAEYLFFLSADIIPPDDVIERLKAHSKPVVNALYMNRNQEERAIAWVKDDPNQTFLNQDLVKIDGAGFECTLIHESAYTKCDWNHKLPDDDYPIYDQWNKLGIDSYLDTTVRCKHYVDKDTHV